MIHTHTYLLHNKHEALDDFEVFKIEVEKQCCKQIKIVKSDRGGEYYEKYTEDGQAHGPLMRYLQENGIVTEIRYACSLYLNGVAEKIEH